MKHIFKRKKAPPEEPTVLSFLDCIAPGVLKFETDHYISGNTWRCVWALREYPAPPILRHCWGAWATGAA